MIGPLKGHLSSLLAVCAIPGSQQVVTADVSGIVKVWDIRTFSSVQSMSVTRIYDTVARYVHCLPSTTVCPQLLFALNYCLPSATVCPQLLVALNCCLPSTAVCPQLLSALNCCLPSTNMDIKYD